MDQSDSPRDLRLVQITDCHLYADPAGDLMGVNTQETLEGVLAAAFSPTWPQADALVATGDLVHDCSVEGYRTLGRLLRGRARKVAVLPGNHDAPEAMAQVLPPLGVQVGGDLRLGNWRLVMLDGHLPGSDGGRLSQDELDRLDELLANGGEGEHLLIFVHHPPVAIGSTWLDRIALENGDALLDRVRRHASIKGIVCGHVHQEWQQQLGQAQLLTTPSTCIQFEPRQGRFRLAQDPPGWREFELHPDGRFSSRVLTLSQKPDGLLMQSHGY